jgi:hypothetical protein
LRTPLAEVARDDLAVYRERRVRDRAVQVSEQFCSDAAQSVRLSCRTSDSVPRQATAFCMRVHATRARLDSLGTRNQRAYNMETHYPTFHGEYWVYALAGVVIITLGIFLYTV